MTLAQMLTVLRARYRFVLGVLLAAVLCAVAVSVLWPKVYEASTSLVLNYKGVDPVSGLAMSPQLMPGYMATQIDIIKSENVAMRVVDELKLAEQASYIDAFNNATGGQGDIRAWTARIIADKIRVVPSRESSVIDVTFRSSDPQLAAAIANTFATQYLQTIVRLNRDPLKNVSSYFTVQIKTLRENLETARNKLSKYQQDKGIVNADNDLDVETTRLNELSTQLVVVQGELMEARSRRQQARGAGASESPDVIANPLIQSLKASLVEAEAKFAKVQQRLETEHPHYLSAQAEVAQLRTELNRHIQATSNSIANNARVIEQRERELRRALETQKTKVLELNRARDQLAVLSKDVESAQLAYDSAVQRFNQTSLEGQASQPDATILTPAIAPFKPWFPRLPLNVGIASVLGLTLGVLIALLGEFLRARIRSADDLSTALQAPVLAAFSWTSRATAPAGLARRPAIQRLLTH